MLIRARDIEMAILTEACTKNSGGLLVDERQVDRCLWLDFEPGSFKDSGSGTLQLSHFQGPRRGLQWPTVIDSQQLGRPSVSPPAWLPRAER
jgi:hypothetical protein